MKKRSLLLVTAGLAVVSLASCGGTVASLEVKLPTLEGFTFTTSQEKAVVGTEFSLTVTNSSPTTKRLKSVELNGEKLDGYVSGSKTLYTFKVPAASELNITATAAVLYGVSSTNLVLDGLISTYYEAGETVSFTPYLKSVEALADVVVKTGTTTVTTTKTDGVYTFTMPEGDVEITGVAAVSPTYDVILPDDLEGFIFKSDIADTEEGETVKVTIEKVPNTNYLLSDVKVYDEEVELLTDGTKGIFYFEMRDENAVVTAKETLLYEVTISSEIEVTDESDFVAAGESAGFVLKNPSLAESIVILDGNGEEVSYTITHGFVEFTMPASDVTVTIKEKAIIGDLLHAISLTSLENKGTATNITSTYASGKTTYEYESGVDAYGTFLHVNKKGAYSSEDLYLGYDKSGNEYTIQKDGDTFSSVSTVVTDDERTSVKYDLFTYQVPVYGTKGALSLIANGIIDNTFDKTKVLKTNEGYDVSFCTLIKESSDTKLFTIDASVELVSGAATKVDITSVGYASSEYDVDVENNTVELHKDASALYNKALTIESSYGLPSATHDYDYESFLFEDFELVDATTGEAIPDSFTIESGWSSGKNILLKSTSETATAKVDTPIVTADPSDGISASYNSYGGKVSITGSAAGTYVVTISTKNVSKTLTVTVVLPKPTEVSGINTYVLSGTEYTSDYLMVTTPTEETPVQKASVTLFEGSTISLSPSFNPDLADSAFTGEVIDGGDDGITGKATTITMWGEESAVYEVTGNKVGTYKIKLSSAVESSVFVEVTVEVAAKPSIDALVAKRYGYTMRAGMGSPEELVLGVEFAPNAEDAKTGTVTIFDNHNMQMGGEATTTTYNYTYAEDTSRFTLTTTGGDATTTALSFNGSFNLVYETVDVYEDGEVAYSQELKELTASMVTGTSFADYENTGLSLYLDYEKSSASLSRWSEDSGYQEGIIKFTCTVTSLNSVEFTITDASSACTTFGYTSLKSFTYNGEEKSITLVFEKELVEETIVLTTSY